MTQGSSARPVVVGVDGSSAALAAARFALEEARARSAPLHVVTAVSWPYDGVTALPPQADVAALLRDGGRVIAQAASEALARVAGDVDLRTCVVDGHPVDVLLEMSEGAQLIVLGSRGVGGVGGVLPGSTASRVVARAVCPVVVLPDETDLLVRHRRSVVVGVEGRQDDSEVLSYAFAEAARRGTDLVAVHAWQDAALEPALRMLGPLVDWAAVRTDEERVLAEALAGWSEKEPDVVVREVVMRDRTARALVAASMLAQLLVVGSRVRRALGSTAHGVLHRSACPVAVVPIGTGVGQ